MVGFSKEINDLQKVEFTLIYNSIDRATFVDNVDPAIFLILHE